MKKLLIMFVLCCLAVCGQAQEHLTFKGIPITGTMTEFCQKLKNKGLTQIGKPEKVTLFRGDFTGQQATIGVVAADNGKDVYGVCVIFDESDTWNTIVNTYTHYKGLYTEKYGEPIDCKENNPNRSDLNIAKMQALDNADFAYYSVFGASGGMIQISICKADSYCKGYVMIRYEDSQNIQSKRKSDLDEI